MSLLQKIRNKKEDVMFEKGNLHVYVDEMKNIQLRNEKDYFILGCYNEDRSTFINLATGEIFELNQTYGDTMELKLADRSMFLISNYGKFDFIGEKMVLKINDYSNSKNKFWKRTLVIDYKDRKSGNFKKLKAFYEFLIDSDSHSKISLKKIKKIYSDVNDYIDGEISKELTVLQNL